MADTMLRPEATKSFQLELNQANGSSIVEILNFATLNAALTPPAGYLASSCSANRIITLQAQYILPSIIGIEPPNIYEEESEAEKQAKFNEALAKAPSKGLALYVDTGSGWKQRSQIQLQNHGKTNIGAWSFRPLLNPLLDDGTGFYGPGDKIGASIVNVGSGTLGTADKIILIGSTLTIPSFVIDNGAVPFTNAANFAATVTSSTPVQCLPARSTRKELRLTTTQDVWFRFGSSSAGVAANTCAKLAAGGALTYENGRLSFEGERGELIAKSYTQGFALYAIAASATAVISGEEFW
ncbi:hypothetical protein [Kamptonema formosum]|uniref:hypothetical protein n=1 Tax=Kamptonema formosum TaxID=331992 RepID=UPI000349364E|nr:hypothetical protein [Kamptonema formosum]